MPETERPSEADALARLIRAAGERPPVPEERQARVRQAVRVEWLAQARRHRRMRSYYWAGAGLAAALLVVAAIPYLRSPSGSPADEAVATLELTRGAVRLGLGAETRDSLVGETLRSSAAVETPKGSRAALRLAGGQSLRLDEETRLVLRNARSLALERGAVYVDTRGAAAGSESVVIETPFGATRDVGTQFEVRLASGALTVRVREGHVELDRKGEIGRAEAGVELAVQESGVARRVFAPDDPSWKWVLDCAPAFKLSGKTLQEFLDWACHEGRWEWRFAGGMRASAPPLTTTLQGSLEGLTPLEALDAVLPAAGISYELKNGEIILRPH